jgi:uncharacterized membrane-anchored protein
MYATESETFVEKSIRFVKDAVDLYPDMPMIPDSPISQSTAPLICYHVNHFYYH